MTELMKVRRWDDSVLLNDNAKDFSGFRWQYTKPIHTTIAGNSIPQATTVMERWWDATFEFATDDPVNTIARYNTLCYDANNDRYFAFVDIDGSVYKAQIMAVVEISRENFPTAHVLQAKCTFKHAGFIPPLTSTDPPEVITYNLTYRGAWSNTTTYALYDVVTSGTNVWSSKLGGNLNHALPTSPATSNTWWERLSAQYEGAWSSATTYALNDVTSYSGALYRSLVSTNLNHTPNTSTTQWQLLAEAP